MMLQNGVEAIHHGQNLVFSFIVEEKTVKKIILIMILSIGIGLAGCSGMSNTQQRTLSGGAIGASAGAVAGAIAGNTGMGLAIGAAAGVAGGYIYDQHEKSKDAAYKDGYNAGKQAPK